MEETDPTLLDTNPHHPWTRSVRAADQPRVSILVVTYNSSDYIEDCLASVIRHTKIPYEILLIDNGKDGTEARVRSLFPSVRIVPSRGNIGFGPANNLLAELARGERLLLLNPDTKLLDPAIDRLVVFADRQPAGAWGGVTTYPNGEPDVGNFLEIPEFKSVLLNAFMPATRGRSPERQLPSAPERVSVLCGGFVLISREAWAALGGFDPTFLLYSEEIDLFARLRKIGYEAWVTPESRIIHDVGSGQHLSAKRNLFLFTGQMHFARRHWRAPRAQLAGLSFWAQAARRWVISAVLGLVVAHHEARRRSYDKVVLAPSSWWRGYEGRTSLD